MAAATARETVLRKQFFISLNSSFLQFSIQRVYRGRATQRIRGNKNWFFPHFSLLRLRKYLIVIPGHVFRHLAYYKWEGNEIYLLFAIASQYFKINKFENNFIILIFIEIHSIDGCSKFMFAFNSANERIGHHVSSLAVQTRALASPFSAISFD